MNRNIATNQKIPYVDIRAEFLSLIPPLRGFSGCLTKDGEHENERGTIVLAYNIAKALLQSFEGSS